MNDLYRWIVTEKPLLETIANVSVRANLVTHILAMFSAERGDVSGDALLDDIRISLA